MIQFLLLLLCTASLFAATEVVKTIRADGTGNYTTVNAWQVGEKRNLVTADQIAVARIEGSWANEENGAVVFDDAVWVTDATHYIKIYTAPEARHNGIWNNTKYRIIGNYGTIQVRSTHNVRVDGLQITAGTFGDNNERGITSATHDAGGMWVSNCIIRANPLVTSGTCTYAQGIYVGQGINGDVFIYNNIIYGFKNTGANTSNAGISVVTHASGKTYVYNNTIVDCAIGVSGHWSLPIMAKNNLTQGCNAGFANGAAAGSDYNLSSTNDAPGSNSKNSAVVTFVDAANKNYHLAIGDAGAQNAGMDLTADGNFPFSTDIDGETRVTPWEIGADDCAGKRPPVITVHPSNQNIETGQTASFSVTATTDTGSLTYQWQDSSSAHVWQNISSAVSSSYTTPAAALAQNGTKFRCNVTNPLGTVASNSALLTVAQADLADPVVSGIAVAGGATLNCGTSHAITWTASDDIAVVKCSVFVSYNNGSSYAYLADSAAANITAGSKMWAIASNQIGAACKIKVSVHDAKGKKSSAESSVFSIVDNIPPIDSVAAPNGGEGWPVDADREIKWIASDNISVARCSLYYSLNNTSWVPIASVSGAGGTYTWHTPGTSAPTVWVKVVAVDAAGSKISDVSDASFSLTSKPYFTSKDTVSVRVGRVLSYTITYDNGNIPGTPTLSLIKKPQWVFYVGTILSGTAPATERTDTVDLELELGGARDTIHIKIRVFDPTLPGVQNAVAPDLRPDFQFRADASGMAFSVQTVLAGDYDLRLYDSNGRCVWKQLCSFTAPGRATITGPALGSGGIYLAVLKGPECRILKKVTWLQ